MFLTDTAWPNGLLTIFQNCCESRELLEYRYYGPFIKLLSYCFGEGYEFFVAPYISIYDLHNKIVDLPLLLTVFDAKRRPVLVMDIKDDKWAGSACRRIRADELMRLRLCDMHSDCPISRLWGLSLLGTSLRVYKVHCDATGDITPTFQARPSQSHALSDDFLEFGWNVDILSQEGFEMMKEIVAGILAGVSAL
jgi:hypothetical protein